jgi:hypothetical protein
MSCGAPDYQVLKDQVADFVQIRDQIKASQRSVRRNLLIAGFIALVVGRTNLVPSKIETLGVTFDKVKQENFRYILGLVVIYFVFSFTKEIFLEVRNYWKHERAASFLGKYMGAHHIPRSIPGLPMEFTLTGFLRVFVDYVIPYYVAVLGLGACYRLFPDIFFIFL